MRHVDEDDPGRVHVRQGEGIDDAVEGLVAVIAQVVDHARLRRGKRVLHDIGADAVIVLHQKVRDRSHEPLAGLRQQRHAAGAEGTDVLDLVGKRRQRNIDAGDAEQLAVGHDRIGDRRHRIVVARRGFRVGRRHRALEALGRQGVPFGRVVGIEGREVDAGLALRPVGIERSILGGAEILLAGIVLGLAVKGIRLLGKPAAEREGVLLDIGLQHVDDALAVEIAAFVAAADHACRRAGGACKLGDVAGDVGCDRLRLGARLIQHQRFDTVLGLGNQHVIGGEKDERDDAARHCDQFGRQRFGLELEHECPRMVKTAGFKAAA